MSEPRPSPRARDTRRWWTLGALSFSLFMIMLDNTVVNVALPAIQNDLKIGLSQLEWTINAYTLAFAVLLLLGGKLADFLGRRLIFVSGLVVFTVSSLACGLSSSGTMLIGARAVQGIGAALMLPATLSIISVTFPPEERGMAIGIWAAVSLVALGLGPMVGGVLIQQISWNWIFYINIPIGLAGLTAALLLVPESRDPNRQRLDIPALVLSGLALFAVVFALIEGNRHGWGSALILLCFTGAAVAFALFVLVEAVFPDPMIDLALFKNPTFTGANVVSLLIMLIMFGVFFFVSVFLQRILGYSALKTGVMLMPLTLVLVLVTPIAGKLSDRIGSKWLIAAGMAAIGVGMLLVSRLDQTSGFWSIFPGLVLVGAGIGLTMTPATAAVLGSVPIEKSGVASGVLNTFRQVGGAFGIAIMGAIVSSQLGPLTAGDLGFGPAFVKGVQHALLAAGLIAYAGALIAIVFIGKHRHVAAHEMAEAGA